MHRRRRRCHENGKHYKRCDAAAANAVACGGSISHSSSSSSKSGSRSSSRSRNRVSQAEGRAAQGHREGIHVLDNNSAIMLECRSGGVGRGGMRLKSSTNNNSTRGRVATSATALLALVGSLASNGVLAQQVGNLSGGSDVPCLRIVLVLVLFRRVETRGELLQERHPSISRLALRNTNQSHITQQVGHLILQQ